MTKTLLIKGSKKIYKYCNKIKFVDIKKHDRYQYNILDNIFNKKKTYVIFTIGELYS